MLDELQYAIDGARLASRSSEQRACALALLRMCLSSEQRLLLRAHGGLPRIVEALYLDQAVRADVSLALVRLGALHVIVRDKMSVELLSSSACQFVFQFLAVLQDDSATAACSSECNEACAELVGLVEQADGGPDAVLEAGSLSAVRHDWRLFAWLAVLTTLRQSTGYVASVKSALSGSEHLTAIVRAARYALSACLHCADGEDVLRDVWASFATHALGVLNNLTFANKAVQARMLASGRREAELIALQSAFDEAEARIRRQREALDGPSEFEREQQDDLLCSELRSRAEATDEALGELLGQAYGESVLASVYAMLCQLSELATAKCPLSVSVCGVYCEALNVLINLTNDNRSGYLAIGSTSGPIFESGAGMRFAAGMLDVYVTDAERYDVLCLSLGLLVNLVDRSLANRLHVGRALLGTILAIYANDGTVDLAQGLSADERKVTQAYAALLLGCLVRDNDEARQAVLSRQDLASLIAVLEDFIAYQDAHGVQTIETHRAVNEVISVLRYYAG